MPGLDEAELVEEVSLVALGVMLALVEMALEEQWWEVVVESPAAGIIMRQEPRNNNSSLNT